MSKKILLISGHGDGDSGACATISGKTYKEAEETITMVKKVKQQLQNYDVDVTVYNTSKDCYKVLKNGGSIDFKKYDYVLELHFNACVHDLKGNGKTTGTEILLPTYGAPKATALEKAILSNVSSLGLTNRGPKNQSLMVINSAARQGAKASLFEICFIDDKDDMNIYLKDKDKVAKKIAKAFVDQWSLKKVTTVTEKVAFRSKMVVDPDNRISWIEPGERVVILDSNDKWLKIQYNGTKGYIVKSKTTLG